MISGNVGGQVWFALTSPQAAQFGALAATGLTRRSDAWPR